MPPVPPSLLIRLEITSDAVHFRGNAVGNGMDRDGRLRCQINAHCRIYGHEPEVGHDNAFLKRGRTRE